MGDILEIFGVEYANVAGIKATDNNDQIKTYIRPQGSASITTNGTHNVANYESAIVNVPSGGGVDGDNLSYGFTDRTSAMVGAGQVGYMEVE